MSLGPFNFFTIVQNAFNKISIFCTRVIYYGIEIQKYIILCFISFIILDFVLYTHCMLMIRVHLMSIQSSLQTVLRFIYNRYFWFYDVV